MTFPVRSCPTHPHIGHPGPVRSKNTARSPPLLPVCLVMVILHLVRSPRHLPMAARLPKAALCGAVGRRPYWQRQSTCEAAVGSPPSELRPTWAVRPPQSLKSRTCPRLHQPPPRQCSARTLNGRPSPKWRICNVSPSFHNLPHTAFVCFVAEQTHRASSRPRPPPLASLQLVSSLPLPAP